MNKNKKYMVVILTRGYDRRIVNAESVEQAKEKAAAGMGSQDGFEFGIPESKDRWSVYPVEE